MLAALVRGVHDRVENSLARLGGLDDLVYDTKGDRAGHPADNLLVLGSQAGLDLLPLVSSRRGKTRFASATAGWPSKVVFCPQRASGNRRRTRGCIRIPFIIRCSNGPKYIRSRGRCG